MIKKSFFQLILICLLAFLYVTCAEISKSQTYEGKVIKVIDGDSINIVYKGKPLRIRLAEIDAPERSQPFWKKSREALAYYVAGKEVQIVEVDIDRYERVVGQVYLNDIWVNAELVRGGYAYVYPKYATTKHLYEYESIARESQVGIWSLPGNERMKPWDWRKMKRNN
ncbi:MAG: thermonuclease family protein [Gammaproteobacteria bacterium]